MTLLDDVTGARRLKGATGPTMSIVVAEIAAALLELGGSAHRETVIDRVAVRRGHSMASDDLRAELVSAFDRHLAGAARGGAPALLQLPFGEGSRRWSLTRDAADMAARTEAPSTVALVPATVAEPPPAAAAA